MKFECAFSVRSSPELKCSSPAFVSIAESVCLQHNKCVCLLFGSWFRNPQEKNNYQGKRLLQNFISSRHGPEKVQKQIMRWKTWEDHPASVCILGRCRVVFLHPFISCLVSVIFSGPSLLEVKFCRKVFSLVYYNITLLGFTIILQPLWCTF